MRGEREEQERTGTDGATDARKGPPAWVPVGWWIEAFEDRPTPSEIRGHDCGADEMLVLVAYDICNPRRLARVAGHCQDFGMRVQYSLFECRLPPEVFDRFWSRMKGLANPDEDRVVAYRICEQCAAQVHTFGVMPRSEDVVAYVV